MSHLPDEIRQALERPDGISEETMRPLAEQFDDAVRAVNERLNEAAALLRKNLRSEAIQAASRNPNAMEAAASLDFPELPEWQEILQFLAIQVPQLIDQDKVQQLNEAIVEGQPIEELLKKHRLLAIAKAPLSWRLKVLRRIAEVDQMNPIWLEDIENYEAARRKTLADEVGAAIKSKDLAAIEKLHTELTTSNWVTSPPRELIDSLQHAITKNQVKHQLAELKKTAEQLHAAFSEFNEAAARSLSAQWQDQSQNFGNSMPADLLEEVEPALTWLAELDAYAAVTQQRENAIQTLENALDSRRDLPTLQKAFSNASRFDDPLPVELEQRFRTITEEMRLVGKRKTQLRIVGIVAATLLVAAGVAFWQYRQLQQRRVDDAVTQFSSLVQSNKTSEATAFWKRLETQDKDLTENAALLSLYGQLENQIQKEADRKQEFESYLQQAANEDPASIDQAALNEADKLALSEDEKARVFAIQQQLDQHDRAMADQQTTAALETIAEIRSELNTLENEPLEDFDMGNIKTIITTLDNISRLYPRRTGNVDGQVTIERTRATGLEDAVDEYRRRTAMIAAATKPLFSASTLNAYQAALKRYAQTITTTKTGREYEQSLNENGLWQKGLQSNELPITLRKSLPFGLTKEEIAALLDLQQTIESQTAANPLLEEFKSTTNDALSETGDPLSELDNLKSDISRLPISQLVTIEVNSATDDGKVLRYLAYNRDYQRMREKLTQEAQIGIKHLADADGAVTTSTISGPAKRVHVEPGRTITWLLEELDSRRDALEKDWGAGILKLCAEIRSRRDLDGLVKEELIYQVLQTCAKGSSSMQKHLSAPISALKIREGTRQDWAVPQAPSDTLAPSVESEVIAPIATVFKTIEQDSQKISPATNLEYLWIGFLMRDSSGEIVGRVTQEPKESGDVYIMRPATENPSKVDITVVGKWETDTLRLDSNSGDLNAGRPLFLLGRTD
jgi:hypothetical protein